MEMTCPNCSESITASEVTPGRMGRCAACRALYEVVPPGKLRLIGAQGNGEDGGASESAPNVLYECAGCRNVLESPAALTGWQDRCPMCNHLNVVPAARPAKQHRTTGRTTAQEVPIPYDGKGGESGFGEHSRTILVPEAACSGDQITTDPVPLDCEWADQQPSQQPPLPSETQWFYITGGGNRIGPVAFAVIRDLMQAGHLQPSTMVWREGMDKWNQLGATPEFSATSPAALTQPAPISQWPMPYTPALAPYHPAPIKETSGRSCSVLSIVFGCIAFVLLPPLFGIAGLILGIIGVSQSRDKTAGTIGIVLSALGMIIGMIIGVAVYSSL